MKVIEKEEGVPISQLKVGEIAKIVRWADSNSHYLNKIVQRVGKELFILGENDLFVSIPGGEEFQVQILKPGTLLEI